MAEAIAKGPDHSQRVMKVSRRDLPLSCPLPADEVWNMHPRVYLPVEKERDAVCPYCGTRYILED